MKRLSAINKVVVILWFFKHLLKKFFSIEINAFFCLTLFEVSLKSFFHKKMTVASLVYTISSGSPFPKTSEFSCCDYFLYSKVTALI